MLGEIKIVKNKNAILIVAEVLINKNDTEFYLFKNNELEFIEDNSNIKYTKQNIVISTSEKLHNTPIIPERQIKVLEKKIGQTITVEAGHFPDDGVKKLFKFILKNQKILKDEK